jgi:imidazolonepropionase-like amidohydrolase
VRNGYLADLLLVDGDPLADVRILQNRRRLLAIMQNGVFHKAPPPDLGQRRRAAA